MSGEVSAHATLLERLEAAASRLMLDGPEQLVEALRAAGLHLVTGESIAVLEEARKVKITTRAFDVGGEPEPAFVQSTRGIARAEHAKRAAAARAMKTGGQG